MVEIVWNERPSGSDRLAPNDPNQNLLGDEIMATPTKTTENCNLVSAVFRDRSKANQAYHWLMTHGYTSDDVNVLMSDTTRSKYNEEHDGKNTSGNLGVEGVATGGTIGTVIGATAAAIAAIGTSIALPGLGLIVAGPLLAALAGGGAGAVAGGLIGGLVGLGITESNAKAYESALKEGGVVLGVTPANSEDQSRIKEVFGELDGENIIVTSTKA